jgi:hypothetical protein
MSDQNIIAVTNRYGRVTDRGAEQAEKGDCHDSGHWEAMILSCNMMNREEIWGCALERDQMRSPMRSLQRLVDRQDAYSLSFPFPLILIATSSFLLR